MSTTNRFFRTLARAERATADERWAEAAGLWAEIVAANPVEGRFWLELGKAHEHAGQFDDAIAALDEALRLRAAYPAETARDIARCHAHLGRTEAALEWLERATAMGLRDLEAVRQDDAFAPVRDDERFRAALGVIDTLTMDRDEGWRSDLTFLVREIERRAYNPFLFVSREQFRAAVDDLDGAIPEMSDARIVVELQRLITLLGDGHARIRAPRDRADLQRAAPVQFYLFEEGMYVTAAGAECRDLVGCRVDAVGDTPVKQVIDLFRPLLPRDNGNEQWIRETLPPRLRELATMHALGLTPDEDHLPLVVTDMAGKQRTVRIAADRKMGAADLRDAFPSPAGWTFLPDTLGTERPWYLANPEINYWFRHDPEHRLVYMQFNSVRDAPGEPFAEFCARMFRLLDDLPGVRLVIDIRFNSGGNTFLTHQLLYKIIGGLRINQCGHLFVIIGRRTFSAAQNFTSMLDRHTNAIFVGEPTGSSPTFIGESVDFELPYSRIMANISDLRWVGTWPDDYRTWIAPALYAPPTFAAFSGNRDPAMEAILRFDEAYPHR